MAGQALYFGFCPSTLLGILSLSKEILDFGLDLKFGIWNVEFEMGG